MRDEALCRSSGQPRDGSEALHQAFVVASIDVDSIGVEWLSKSSCYLPCLSRFALASTALLLRCMPRFALASTALHLRGEHRQAKAGPLMKSSPSD